MFPFQSLLVFCVSEFVSIIPLVPKNYHKTKNKQKKQQSLTFTKKGQIHEICESFFD